MSVLILLLKCIGIVLLILLAVLLYILFVPIHFKVALTKNDSYNLNFTLYSSLRFLRITAIYDEVFDYSIKLFWQCLEIASTQKDKAKVSTKQEQATKTKEKRKRNKSITEIVESLIAAKDFIPALLHMIPSIIKSFHLRITSANFRYSLGECDKTAFYYGIMMSLPGAIDDSIVIEPDIQSEETYLQGSLAVKGHFYLVKLLAYGIKLMRNGDLRTLLK